MKRRYLCVYLPLWGLHVWHLTKKAHHTPNFKSTEPQVAMGALAGHDDSSFPVCASIQSTKEYSERHQPLLLYQSGPTQAHVSQRVVLHACPCALRAGVKRGMSITLAEALCPRTPLVVASQPEQEASLLYRLARWALKLSPLVAVDKELSEAVRRKSLPSLSPLHHCFTIDLTGTERIHGNESAVVARIARALESRGITARYAIASSAGAAWAHAHFGSSNPVIIENGSDQATTLEKSLSSLPIESLRLTTKDAVGLRALGIVEVGELLRIPRSKLGVRFPDAQGADGILTRLRQALGTQHETLTFIHPKTILSEVREFEVPLSSHETITHVILGLLEEVFKKLLFERKNTRAIILELRTRTINRAIATLRKELTLCHATRDFAHARSVITPIVESLRNVEGVILISVTARLTTTAQYQQKPLPHLSGQSSVQHVSVESVDESVGELLNNLVARCGRERVVTIERHESYLPEKSFSYRSVASHAHSGSAPLQEPPSQKASGICLKRPSFLFDIPEPATAIAMLPDRPPSQLRWNGERLKILTAEGPERICLEWWQNSLTAIEAHPRTDTASDSRDYFSLQDDTGRWLWVYRENSSSRWFVHGVWI